MVWQNPEQGLASRDHPLRCHMQTLFLVQRVCSLQSAVCLKEQHAMMLPAGPDRQAMEGWRGARYAGRRTLKHGDYVVLKKSSSTPSPPPPSVIIIKKTSAPSPPPPSAVRPQPLINRSALCFELRLKVWPSACMK